MLRAGRDRPGASTFDAPTRERSRRTWLSSATRSPGAGRPSTRRSRGSPVQRYLEPVMTNLSAPDTRLERFISASAAAAAEVAPVAEVQAELFVNLDSTFTALAGVARPFIQETISETPPTFAVAEPRCRRSGRSWTTAPSCSPSSSRGSTRSPGRPADRRDARDRDAGADRLAAAQPRAGPRRRRRCSPSTTTRACAMGSPPAPDDRHRRAGAPLHHPGPDRVQLREPLPGQPRRGDRRGRRRHEVAAVLGVQPPTGPNNEGGVASAPANGGGNFANFLHFNPYPNTAAPGQPNECEAGNEPFAGGQQTIGNAPGNQGTVTAGQPGSDESEEEADGRPFARREPTARHPNRPAPDERIWAAITTAPGRRSSAGDHRGARDRGLSKRSPRSCRSATRATS